MSSTRDVNTPPLQPVVPAAVFVPFDLAVPFDFEADDAPCRYPFPFSCFLSSGPASVGNTVVDDWKVLHSAVRDMTFDKMAVLELVTQVRRLSVERMHAKITTTMVIATRTTASVTAKTMTIPSSSRRSPNCSLPAFS
jgi:hypothetical protein